MHTYTPTASHDAVVEFDNGDLGNQTNLNSMVRALGNRSELAKVTNDSQGSSITTLNSKMLQALDPGYLKATLDMTASGTSFTGGENYIALDNVSTGGTLGSPTLSAVTYTGTGGGTKLIRLAGNTKFRLDVHATVLCPTEAADGGNLSLNLTEGTTTNFDPTLIGAFVMGALMTPSKITGIGAVFTASLSTVIVNGSSSAKYLMLYVSAASTPVADDYILTASRSSLVVQAMGTA
jgi:hypothetical protein